MTRKRFVKLLMARGYDRNTANLMAQKAKSDGVTYADKYFIVRVLDGDGEVADALAAFTQRIVDAVNAWIPCITGAINAAIPRIVEAMSEIRQRAEAIKE